MTSIGEEVEKLRHCILLVRMQTGTAATENSVEVPKTIINRTTVQSIHFTSEYLPERIEIRISKKY